MGIYKIIRILWKLLIAYEGGGLTNAMIVHGPPGGGWIGLADDVLVIAIKMLAEGAGFELTFGEGLALGIFIGEIRKIIEDGEEYWDASDRQRAHIRWEVEHDPAFAEAGPYLYGRISVEDVLWLSFSGKIVGQSEAVTSIWQAVTDIFAVVGDSADVALLA